VGSLESTLIVFDLALKFCAVLVNELLRGKIHVIARDPVTVLVLKELDPLCDFNSASHLSPLYLEFILPPINIICQQFIVNCIKFKVDVT